MKAILEFNLPEEQDEFEMAQSGGKYNVVLFDVMNDIRSKLKYENLTENEDKIYESVRDMIMRYLDQYGVKIV
jgi:hypothetical protein